VDEDVEMTELWMRRMNVKAKLTQYCHHSQDRLSEDRPHVSRELNLNLATMITVNDAFLLAARAPAGSNEVSMLVNVEPLSPELTKRITLVESLAP
jgi:hypothetical protein